MYREIVCADCQYAHVLILDGIKPKLRRQIIPYGFISALGEPGSALQPGAKVGGSAFIGLSAASSVELALNPDFSNVEADIAQVAVNSSFALFYPERRPFFIEGSDQFATRQNYVYTRSIASPLGLTKFTNQGQKYRSYVLTGYDAACRTWFRAEFLGLRNLWCQLVDHRSNSAPPALCFGHWPAWNPAQLL